MLKKKDTSNIKTFVEEKYYEEKNAVKESLKKIFAEIER